MEIKKHLNHIFILISYLVIFCCCSQNREKKRRHDLTRAGSINIEYKDSLYIMFTIQKWMDADFDMYHDYSRDNVGIKRSDIELKISRIYYSDDKTKIFCWITTKTPNNPDCKRPQGYSYSSSDLIGFRNSLGEVWNLYPFELTKAVCFDSEENVVNELEDYYVKQMKGDCEAVNKKFLDKNYGGNVRYDLEQIVDDNGYGDKNSHFIFKNYGYNLKDKLFWSKSLIWQKGARIPGLYNFQTNGAVVPGEENAELILPKITYPNNIKKLFKNLQ